MEINLREQHLKTGTFEIKPEQRVIIQNRDCPGKKRDEWEPYYSMT
jgi:hypothetical protein